MLVNGRPFSAFTAQNLKARSSEMKSVRQLKKPSLLPNSSPTPGLINSSSVKPAGAGLGAWACTMANGMTIARVQDDIS